MNLLHLASCQAKHNKRHDLIQYLLYEFGFQYANHTVAGANYSQFALNYGGQSPLELASDERSREILSHPIDNIKAYITTKIENGTAVGMVPSLYETNPLKWENTSLKHAILLLRQ